MRDDTEYYECKCCDFSHVYRIVFYPLDGDLILETHMNYDFPWYTRVWNAVKYVFNCDTSYGHYASTIIRLEDYDRIREMFAMSEEATSELTARASRVDEENIEPSWSID